MNCKLLKKTSHLHKSRLKKFVVILTALFLIASHAWADDKSTFLSANWSWQAVGSDGAQKGKCTFTNLLGGPQVISIIKYSEDKLNTSLAVYEGKDKANTTSAIATEEKATVAINGSYFYNSSSTASYYLYASTPLWHDGKMNTYNYQPNRSNAIIGFTSDGKIGFDTIANKDYSAQKEKYGTFVASGPLLRIGGKNMEIPSIDDSFDGVNPRSMIGVTNDRTIYMVVVEGRRTEATGTTIEQMQQIAEWLQLTDAINLDGGGSSTLWALGSGVLNTPSDGSQRVVPTVIVGKSKSNEQKTEPDLIDSYYMIENAEQLMWFNQQINAGYSSLNAKLTNDIDLTGKTWTPLGKSSSLSYGGNFDGQGHSISGISQSESVGNAGFIGYYSGTGTIKDLTLNGEISYTGNTADDCIGGVIGRLQSSSATLEDITCNLNIKTPNANGKNVRIAGIVAWLQCKAKINRCRYSGKIEAYSTSGQASGVAGLVTVTAGATITNCLFDGTIIANRSGAYVGGMVGYANLAADKFTCNNNLSCGTISASGSNYGAIVGGKGGSSNAASYTGNVMASGQTSSGSAWGTAAINATSASVEALKNGTILASLGSMTKSSGLYPSSDSKCSWTQDFAAQQAYPVPSKKGFTCTHIKVTETAACSFCGEGSTCTHDWSDRNGVCKLCLQKCSHNFVNGVCSICGVETEYIKPTAGQKLEIDGLYYIVNDDLTSLTVTYPGETVPTSGNNSYTGSITVPAKAEYAGTTFQVTALGDYAFEYATITNLTLSEGLISIGQKAIYATNITTLKVPNSVTTTAYESLGYNTKLASITFGENIAANKWGDKLCYNPSGAGVKKDIYMLCREVPTLQSYTFSFAGAVIHVYPTMVNAFKNSASWSEYEIVGDIAVEYTYEDLQSTIKQYSGLTPQGNEVGTDPGCYSASSVKAVTNAISEAGKLNGDASTKEINDAINNILNTYDALYTYPLNEGVYCLENVAYPNTALYGDASTSDTKGLKSASLDTTTEKFYFKLTRKNGRWSMQSMDNKMYVGTTIGTGAGKSISLTSEPDNQLAITWVKGGQFALQCAYASSLSGVLLSNGSDITTNSYANPTASMTTGLWRIHPAEPGKYNMVYNLENSRVQQFVHEFEYAKGDASKVTSYNITPPDRRDQPQPVALFWKRNETSTTQQVVLSLQTDFGKSQTINVDNEVTSCEIFNLIPDTTYYYKVIATDANGISRELYSSTLKTAGQVRMIKANSVCNIRDLGGWMTSNGNRIPYGKIFRGARFDEIQPADTKVIASLGIKAELDLRSSSEVGSRKSSALGDSVEFKHIAHAQTTSRYEAVKDYPNLMKQDLQYVFECVANDKPVYFHCSIGADRTGTLAILLEALLGVSESDIYKDYELTTFSHYGTTRTKSDLVEMYNYLATFGGEDLESNVKNYCTKQLGIAEEEINNFKIKLLGTPKLGLVPYGIYYIHNGYIKRYSLYIDNDASQTKLGAIDKDNKKFYFRLIPNGENWNLQCLDNDKYIGTGATSATTGNITATVNPQYAQTISKAKDSEGGYYITSQYGEDLSGNTVTFQNQLNKLSLGNGTTNRQWWYFVRISADSVSNNIATFSAQDLNAAQLNIAMADAESKGASIMDFTQASFADEVTGSDFVLNNNLLAYVSDTSAINGKNIINNGVCEELELTNQASFTTPTTFAANKASLALVCPTNTQWQGTILPFDITVPNGMVVLTNASQNGTNVNFNQVMPGTNLPANTPFIFTPTGETTLFTTNNTSVTTEPQKSGILYATYIEIPAQQATDKLVVNNEGMGFVSTSEAIRPFSTYLDSALDSSLSIQIVDELTAISSLANAEYKLIDVYTLDGKVIRSQVYPTTALKGLPHGIYLVNGQKVVR